MVMDKGKYDRAVKRAKDNLRLLYLSDKLIFKAKSNLEKALIQVNDSIAHRISSIVIKADLGYKDDDLDRAFPERVSWGETGGILTPIMKDEYGREHSFYFSRELHIFIEGQPEKRDDGYYCVITGNKLK